MTVGLLHPGEMGAALGAALLAAGHEVLWASEGRSKATHLRAASFSDAGTAAELVARSEVVFSVVPPHASLELAESLPSFPGIYVDANAVSPATAARVGSAVERFVDGGIIGGPGAPRLYLSGAEAARVAALFEGSFVETQIVASASALKCAYAAWSKGSGALLLAARSRSSQTGSPPRSARRRARGGAGSRRWRRSPPRSRRTDFRPASTKPRPRCTALPSASAETRGRPSTWPDPASVR